MYDEMINHFPNIEILKNKKLSDYTWTKTGGIADMIAFPKTFEETESLLKYAKNKSISITIIGNASNLIIRDGGISGIVIILNKMDKVFVSGNDLTAEAGVAYIEATKVAQQNNLSGLEFAAGIPGSVGGGVYMNAGAYGGETKQVLKSVKVLNEKNEIQVLKHEDLNFGYRYSSLQDNHLTVLEATFSLIKKDGNLIQQEMDHLNHLRKSKQPLEYPSCGSVFKRPTGYFAGKLIHDSNLQGYRNGGAEVSKKHAGFIVNVDNATASDYLNVINHVQETVKNKFGVSLETEVRIIGNKSDSEGK
ncbi:UDP-N-acetylmuramate dehydrogenase [Lactobacillus sp. S2-2]|uniref:UDP-N-acetylmuramate dehydrogenase n=1 Tax=Lactobacillus sp. S2-2 TaxID=2692917 RepID=UPI001F0144C1|nr:UDP-N-acetylmuramate dehydrogenase [Lactobacillus sp. S2-2]MCF6515712.1 UDP-N-acetylmuramate dehydrogenase [Lactobacillus sp. S2-2]